MAKKNAGNNANANNTEASTVVSPSNPRLTRKGLDAYAQRLEGIVNGSTFYVRTTDGGSQLFGNVPGRSPIVSEIMPTKDLTRYCDAFVHGIEIGRTLQAS